MDGEKETRSVGELSILPPIVVSVFREQPGGDRELLLSWPLDGPLPDMRETVCLDRRVPNLSSDRA